MANAPVISADDDTIVEIVKDAINSGRHATLYLSSAQSSAVRSWLLTPEADSVIKRLRRHSGLALIAGHSVSKH
jgi:ethanolamine ammonia-lyase large subunit